MSAHSEICQFCGGEIIFRVILGLITPIHLGEKECEGRRLYRRDQEGIAHLTKCPRCTASVYFLRHNGGSVWLESLGCPSTDNASEKTMNASNEELTKAVVRLAGTVAAMAELQATIAKIVVPLSNHHDESQKRQALSEIEKMAVAVRELQQSLNHLASNASEATKPAVAQLSSEAIAKIREQVNAVETEHPDLARRAQSGDPKAQFEFGKLFENKAEDPPGEGSWFELSSPWYEKAAEWYRKSAEQGFIPAQYELAVAYRFGFGLPQDRVEAISWCRKAQAGGFDQASMELATLLEDSDKNEAIAVYEALANQENVEAMMKLVAIYDDEDGLYVDKPKAFKWSLHAAEAGSADACEKVGSKYLEGEGTPRDFDWAVKWSLKIADPFIAESAELNWTSVSPILWAQFSLVQAYADPEYDKQDLVESLKWLDLAISSGLADDTFKIHLKAEREILTNAMTTHQISTAKQRAAKFHAPLKKFIFDICGTDFSSKCAQV